MANITQNTNAPMVSIAAFRATNKIETAFSTVSNWNKARKTRAALSALTSRELEDIGLSRGDINRIR